MRGLFVSAVAAFGAFAFACNPEPPKKAKVVMVGDSTPNKGNSASDTSGDDDDNVETNHPADESTSPENTSPDDDTTKPSDPNTPPTAPSTPQPKDCEAKADGNTSTTNVMYVEQNGHANISSMTVTIANKNHRNQNDVDVYVTPNGGKETFVLNSKDILMDGQTTAVPLPSNFSVTQGSRIRVKTNFDDSFGDPSESCTLQF